MTFDEWWEQSDLKYAEQESAFQAWSAALEEAVKICEKNHEEGDENCFQFGCHIQDAKAIRALKEGK